MAHGGGPSIKASWGLTASNATKHPALVHASHFFVSIIVKVKYRVQKAFHLFATW
jgi:hypothetical protein